MAAPGISFRGGGNPCAYRVEMDIANKFKEVGIGFDEECLVSPLEEVPRAISRGIDPTCVPLRDVLHDPRQRRLLDLHDKVNVV